MKNPFNNPGYYRQQILNNKLLKFEKKKLEGKALACLFLTRFCSTGCPFCFYKSAPAWRKRHIEDQFNDEGLDKFITFANQANLGYLLVSGGGEPLNQRKHILQLVKKIETDRIVLVTSANWGKNYIAAKRYIDDIYKAFKTREKPTKLVVRVSVSEGHVIKIGLQPAINLIKIFSENYANEKNFIMQVKTFDNDLTFDKVLECYPKHQKELSTPLMSDNDVLVKKIPNRYNVKIGDYEFVVGLSKLFNSGLKPNINNPKLLSNYIKVFDADLYDSEDDNPTTVYNPDGNHGIDWSINYNGDICTWQNQVRDNYMNLYEDDYQQIFKATFEDPITYSVIDKGSSYRERIVLEVDPKAVIRTKAIGLRDTSGAIMFEEERTRLYYAIRVLQDYIFEGKVTAKHMAKWPKEITGLTSCTKDELKKLYRASNYTIIQQQYSKIFSETKWSDLFQLIKLGHYTLTEQEISSAIQYYNQHAVEKITSLYKHEFSGGDIERRLTERLMHIKPLKQLNNTVDKYIVPQPIPAQVVERTLEYV
jgi:organic radical activating enzyme